MTEKLPEKWLEVITKTVLKERERQEKTFLKEQQDHRFRNTDLLVKNYRKLSAHCEHLPEQMDIIHQEIDLGLLEQTIDLKEVMKSKHKTKMMMDYVDAMMAAYKRLAYSSGSVAERRYRILYDVYLCPQHLKPQDLFEKYGVERATFYKDLRKAVEEFSVVLFGIDAYALQLNGKSGDKR